MMYCTHCGKAIDENATVCPFCGETVGESNVQTTTQDANAQSPKQPKPQKDPSNAEFPLEIITLVLAAIGFVTALVFGSMLFAHKLGVLLYLLGSMTVLPSLIALCSSIYILRCKTNKKKRLFAFISISLAGFALFYMFLVGCIVA